MTTYQHFEPRAVSPAKLAERWDCSKATIIRMMKRGDLVRSDFPLIRFDLKQIEAIERGERAVAATFIYFIRSGDLVKIGVTQDIIYRLRNIAAMSPIPVTLIKTVPGNVGDEKRLHAKFRPYRSHGEWFRIEGELRDYLLGEAA